ncbi:MAG: response regulator [Minisyncoccia bacterium]
MLLHAGYQVEVAENGDRGIEMARKEMPDLILCDIRMPLKDG